MPGFSCFLRTDFCSFGWLGFVIVVVVVVETGSHHVALAVLEL